MTGIVGWIEDRKWDEKNEIQSYADRKRLRQENGPYLAEKAVFLLDIFAEDAKSSDSLSVQSHVLGERLSDGDAEALGDKMANRESVFIAVAGSVALELEMTIYSTEEPQRYKITSKWTLVLIVCLFCGCYEGALEKRFPPPSHPRWIASIEHLISHVENGEVIFTFTNVG